VQIWRVWTHDPHTVLISERAHRSEDNVLPLRSATANYRKTPERSYRSLRFFPLGAGRSDRVGFLGEAQIDKFANINSTRHRRLQQAKVRLPGLGGAQEIAGFAAR